MGIAQQFQSDSEFDFYRNDIVCRLRLVKVPTVCPECQSPLGVSQSRGTLASGCWRACYCAPAKRSERPKRPERADRFVFTKALFIGAGNRRDQVAKPGDQGQRAALNTGNRDLRGGCWCRFSPASGG